jgi:hypothetical protein
MKIRATPTLLMALFLGQLASPADGQHTLFTFEGSAPGMPYGGWVGGLGDMNGDGTEDFAVTEAITADVRSGVDGAILFTVPANPPPLGTVRDAGDVNGNGTPDLITGFLDFFGPGEIWFQVYDGSGGLIHEILAPPWPSHLPFEVSQDGIGDINQDGYDDFILGIPYAAGTRGKAFVYSGKDKTVLRTYTGTNNEDILGLRVSGVGDLDGDGMPDYSISTPGFDDPSQGIVDGGRVQFFRGTDGSLLFDRKGANNDFLYGAEGLGDVNGDGYDDVAMVAPYHSATYQLAGVVHVAFGPNGVSGYSIEGSHDFELLGIPNVSAAGDLDGDGLPDLIVGSMMNTVGGPCGGRAATYRGHNGQLFHEWYGQDCDQLGSVGTFDQNGDGLGDLLIGAYGYDNARGQARVVRTCPAASQNYGQGFAGLTGIPTLVPRTDPVFGAPITVDIGNSSGASTFGLVLMGLAKDSVQISAGATLLVNPDWVLPVMIPAAGLPFAGAIEDDPATWCGHELDLQVVQMDAAATGGWSFSPGLELKPGYDYP